MEQITIKEILEAVDGKLLAGSEDVAVRHISIDSRTMKGDDIFVPLIGEKVDAHDFISQAFSNGAVAVLTSRNEVLPVYDDKPWILVNDTKKALQDIGAYYRKRLTLPLIGVTGSVGKTTTREMIAAALSAGLQVYKTPLNHNSQVGVPITLSEVGPQDQIGVIELGMSEPGELTVIAKLAQIDLAVITNVGVAHIEQLGSRENILKEKLTIQDGLKEGGILLLNGDNDLLSTVSARSGIKTLYYGTGENCDYRAVNIKLDQGKPSFDMVYQGKILPVSLQVLGEHNILNALASLAVANEFGLDLEAATKQLLEFDGFKSRQQIYNHQGITVIDDAYNASPESMRAGLKVLDSLHQCKRRIAVLADMKELGIDAPFFHMDMGTWLSDLSIDGVITLGPLATLIGETAKATKPSMTVKSFEDKEELTKYLKDFLQEGDAVLFKGSNSMKLSQVSALFAGRE